MHLSLTDDIQLIFCFFLQGILSPVYLDGNVLKSWKIVAIPFQNLNEVLDIKPIKEIAHSRINKTLALTNIKNTGMFSILTYDTYKYKQLVKVRTSVRVLFCFYCINLFGIYLFLVCISIFHSEPHLPALVPLILVQLTMVCNNASYCGGTMKVIIITFPSAEEVSIEPALYAGRFVVDETKDTFISFSGWGKGIAFVNEFNIGRFWPVKWCFPHFSDSLVILNWCLYS